MALYLGNQKIGALKVIDEPVNLLITENSDGTQNLDFVEHQEGITVNLQHKLVTENGEIIPDEGYNGLSSVTVNVESIQEDLSEEIVVQTGLIEQIQTTLQQKVIKNVEITINNLSNESIIIKYLPPDNYIFTPASIPNNSSINLLVPLYSVILIPENGQGEIPIISGEACIGGQYDETVGNYTSIIQPDLLNISYQSE